MELLLLSGLIALAVLGLVGLCILAALYYAWAASILWSWFVTPVFHLPEITVLQAWGLLLIIALVRSNALSTAKHEAMERQEIAVRVSQAVMGPLVALGMGYVIRFWWM